MQELLRFAVSGIAAVASFYFVFWLPCSVLLPRGTPWVVPFALSATASFYATRYVWRRTERFPTGLATSVGVGAFILGGVGFCGGFFGPMILSPDANQGPLLGIFITGPLGFLLGGIGGGVWWYLRGREAQRA
jgi:hypothetical protein